MRCPKAKKILSDYLDDNLSNRKRTQLKAHLRECSDCDAELVQLRSLSAILQSAGEVEAPEEYWDNYWHRLSVKLPPIKACSNWIQGLLQLFGKPIPVVYALLAVLLVGLTVFFSDSYLDSRKTKSPEVTIATGDSYYYRPARAGRAAGVTESTKPQSLQEEIKEDRKFPAVIEQLDSSEREFDDIKKTEMATQRGEMMDKLKESAEITPQSTKPERSLHTKAKLRAVEEKKLGQLAEHKIGRDDIQLDKGVEKETTQEELMLEQRRKRSVSEAAPEFAAEGLAMETETVPKKSVESRENARQLQYKRKQARGVQHRRPSETTNLLALSALGGKYAEPYGLIIRVLKIQPADARLNMNISKGTASDGVFFSKLQESNSEVNLESEFSSKTVTLVGGETSLSFKSGTRDYTFQLKVLPPSDNQKEHRLAYLKHYSAPKPGETVMFDIPEADSDKNNFVVLVTRFKP